VNEALLRRIKELEAEANRVIQEYERGISRLYLRIKVSGGGIRNLPKADPEATRQVEAELRAQRTQALRAIEREAQELLGQARSVEQEQAQQFSPDRVLSAEEREAAVQRLPLVEADVGTLRGEALTRRMRGILAGGTAAEKFAYWMAGRRRAEEMRERQVAAARSGAANPNAPVSEEVRATPIDAVLTQLEEALLGEERRGRIEKAREVVQAADEVVRTCYLTRHDAKDAYAVSMKGRYHCPAEPITDPSANTYTVTRGGPIAR
jgi:hypothetical protein